MKNLFKIISALVLCLAISGTVLAAKPSGDVQLSELSVPEYSVTNVTVSANVQYIVIVYLGNTAMTISSVQPAGTQTFGLQVHSSAMYEIQVAKSIKWNKWQVLDSAILTVE